MAVKARARDLGVIVGTLPTGPLNAITDVAGVRVGHATLNQGANIRTGVTAILPHPGNLFREKVPGAVFIGNAFGKLVGSTQVNELGEIETPILLTSTLNVFRVADELINYMLSLDGNAQVRSINPLVGETNDGVLNDIQGRHVGHNEVFAALQSAKSGSVEEGCVGAGAGTICFGWKGGIGTSSRKVGENTIGVLVQTNFGGRLTILGVPIERPRTVATNRVTASRVTASRVTADGSIMMIVATDAPVDHRNLQRLAARTMMGLGRTGSAGSNGSGDYAIAFTTSRKTDLLSNDAVSALFPAVIEATEEAIYNSLFRAETTTGNGRTVDALPVESTIEALRRHGMIRQN
jgi:D-aminopeptidase